MALNGNLNIIWDNRFFDAAALTASSAQAGYPVTCVQDKVRTRTWRTVGLADEFLVADMGESIYCTCLALVQHNFTVNARVRVQASDLPDFSVLLKDEEYDACEEMIGFGEGGFGAHGAGGTILYEERSFYAPYTLRINYFDPVGGDHVRARYWRLLFSDAANPSGYFELGRVFLCTYDSYEVQFEFDWVYGGQDDSQIDASVGSQDWIDRREVRDILRLPWKTFPDVDKYWRFRFFAKKVGLSREFVIDPVPLGRSSERFFLAKYCRLNEIPEMVAITPGLSEVELAVIELI